MRRYFNLICAVFFALLAANSGWAIAQKEKEAALWKYCSNELAPNIGPIAHYRQLDEQWDLLWSINAEGICYDNQLLGAEFAGGRFYITGGGAYGPAINKVYVVNPDGTLYYVFEQWSSTGWGWRDLAYDGTYLYGSDDYVVDCFDLDGNPVPEMNINGPINPCRALTYDPTTDHFWTQSFDGLLYEFSRDGTVIWSGNSGAVAYGAAWDDGTPYGRPWLWIFSQSGIPLTSFHQFDPINHEPTGLVYQMPLLPELSDQIAGGAFFTNEWISDYYVIGGIAQGTPYDMLFCLEMYDNANPWAPAAPDNFEVLFDQTGALIANLSWILPVTTINGSPIGTYPIASVEILREGDSIASLGASATSYSDNTVPSAGMYTYTAYCVNDSGNGLAVYESAPIGLDVPAGVEHFTMEYNGYQLQVDLDWENPTTGYNGGYFPPGSIDGYILNRYGPDPETVQITGVTSSYFDVTITFPGWYEYGIRAYNSTGYGPEVLTGVSYVGVPQFEEIQYEWTEINPGLGGLPGIDTGISGDDQNLGPFPIGFSFPWYNGAVYDQIRICSNGFAFRNIHLLPPG